mgnify:CR=1 FL=1
MTTQIRNDDFKPSGYEWLNVSPPNSLGFRVTVNEEKRFLFGIKPLRARRVYCLEFDIRFTTYKIRAVGRLLKLLHSSLFKNFSLLLHVN